jgi:Arc/MetJ-type ribon-helix-helix transcriptional regulator
LQGSEKNLATIQKKRVEVTMNTCYLEGMNLLLKDGLYESQAEIVKDALRRLFNHYEIRIIEESEAEI